MTSRIEQFLAGERPDDVALYFADDQLRDRDVPDEHAEMVDGGLVVVVQGDRGRSVFSSAVGVDAMRFARSAMGQEGTIEHDLSGGSCPEGTGADHGIRFVFAFAEEENEEAGGLYAEGAVIHAYARCTCGANYSDRWVAASVS